MTLRRTPTPYLGQAIILSVSSLLLFSLAYETREWNLLWSAALFWTLFAIYIVLFAMKYKILWNPKEVIMRASGGPEQRIPFDEISEIRKETAPASEFLSQARPFRRIVVYGRKHGPIRRIDISLRHFRSQDIEDLLTAIRLQRPDLDIPTVLENHGVGSNSIENGT
jgi:hypothetical protein